MTQSFQLPTPAEMNSAALAYEQLIKAKREKERTLRKQRNIRRRKLLSALDTTSPSFENDIHSEELHQQSFAQSTPEKPISSLSSKIQTLDSCLSTKSKTFHHKVHEQETMDMEKYDQVEKVHKQHRTELARRRTEAELCRYQELKQRSQRLLNREANQITSSIISDLIDDVSTITDMRSQSRLYDYSPTECKELDHSLTNQLLCEEENEDDEGPCSVKMDTSSFLTLIKSIKNIVDPPPPPVEPPKLSPFPIKLMVVGPSCSGKTRICQLLSKRFEFVLVSKAVFESLLESDLDQNDDVFVRKNVELLKKFKENPDDSELLADLIFNFVNNDDETKGFVIDASLFSFDEICMVEQKFTGNNPSSLLAKKKPGKQTKSQSFSSIFDLVISIEATLENCSIRNQNRILVNNQVFNSQLDPPPFEGEFTSEVAELVPVAERYHEFEEVSKSITTIYSQSVSNPLKSINSDGKEVSEVLSVVENEVCSTIAQINEALEKQRLEKEKEELEVLKKQEELNANKSEEELKLEELQKQFEVLKETNVVIDDLEMLTVDVCNDVFQKWQSVVSDAKQSISSLINDYNAIRTNSVNNSFAISDFVSQLFTSPIQELDFELLNIQKEIAKLHPKLRSDPEIKSHLALKVAESRDLMLGVINDCMGNYLSKIKEVIFSNSFIELAEKVLLLSIHLIKHCCTKFNADFTLILEVFSLICNISLPELESKPSKTNASSSKSSKTDTKSSKKQEKSPITPSVTPFKLSLKDDIGPDTSDLGAVEKYDHVEVLKSPLQSAENQYILVEKAKNHWNVALSVLDTEITEFESKLADLNSKFDTLTLELSENLDNEELFEQAESMKQLIIQTKKIISLKKSAKTFLPQGISLLNSLEDRFNAVLTHLSYLCERELKILSGCTQSIALYIQSNLIRVRKELKSVVFNAEDLLRDAIKNESPINGVLKVNYSTLSDSFAIKLILDQSRPIVDLPVDLEQVPFEQNLTHQQPCVLFELFCRELVNFLGGRLYVSIHDLSSFLYTCSSSLLSLPCLPSYWQGLSRADIEAVLTQVYPTNVDVDYRHFLGSLILDSPVNDEMTSFSDNLNFESFRDLVKILPIDSVYGEVAKPLFKLFSDNQKVPFKSFLPFIWRRESNFEGIVSLACEIYGSKCGINELSFLFNFGLESNLILSNDLGCFFPNSNSVSIESIAKLPLFKRLAERNPMFHFQSFKNLIENIEKGEKSLKLPAAPTIKKSAKKSQK
ncbi:hypothetical protein P9112_004812 [Eukaryota sp. TZLM1-RC]